MPTGGPTWLPPAGRPGASPGALQSSPFFPQRVAPENGGCLLLPRSVVSVVGSLKPVHRRKGLDVMLIEQAPMRERIPSPDCAPPQALYPF